MHALTRSAGVAATLLGLLAGCAPAPLVQSTRLGATGITGDTSIGVMVLYHERCVEHHEKTGTNCAPGNVTADINSQYSRCVGSAFGHSSSRITIVPGNVLHQKYLAAAEPDYRALTPGRAVELMSVPAASAALLQDGVGYVVLLSSTTKDENRHTMVDAGSQGMWGIGRESRRVTEIEAVVFNTATVVRAGDLRLSIEGESGWMMPVFVILPLPPIPYGSRTESKSCKAMGSAIAEFLYSDATPLSPR
jgi:hypothetical protein